MQNTGKNKGILGKMAMLLPSLMGIGDPVGATKPKVSTTPVFAASELEELKTLSGLAKKHRVRELKALHYATKYVQNKANGA